MEFCSALQEHPEPWTSVENIRGPTAEAQATAFHHAGRKDSDNVY